MANQENSAVKLDVRAYPIAEPKSNTLAFASVTINDMFAVNGIRVVSSKEKGNFVAMPQTKDANGEYRDICFPVTGELRKQLNKAVLDEYESALKAPAKESTVDKLRDAKDAPTAAKGKGAKNKTNPEH